MFDIALYLVATYIGHVLTSVLFGYQAPLPFAEDGPPDWFSATVALSIWVFFAVLLETSMVSRTGHFGRRT